MNICWIGYSQFNAASVGLDADAAAASDSLHSQIENVFIKKKEKIVLAAFIHVKFR